MSLHFLSSPDLYPPLHACSLPAPATLQIETGPAVQREGRVSRIDSSSLDRSFASLSRGANPSFGAGLIGLEFTPPERFAPYVARYASFLHSFLGRGVFYVFLGVLMLNYYVLLYVCGTAVAVVGLVYIALHFWAPFDPPSTMKPPVVDEEAQPVWQAPTED